jgi:hypothetical protein
MMSRDIRERKLYQFRDRAELPSQGVQEVLNWIGQNYPDLCTCSRCLTNWFNWSFEERVDQYDPELKVATVVDGEHVTRSVLYSGRLTTRLCKWIKTGGERINNGKKQELAELINFWRSNGCLYVYDFTSNLHSWSSGEFGDAYSCYWGDRSGARTMLESHGALAMRFYQPKEYDNWSQAQHGYGIGRVWVIPYGDDYIAYNGYWDWDKWHDHNDNISQRLAQILAHHLGGWAVRRISLSNNSEECGLLYINSGSGYLITREPSETSWVNLDWEDELGENEGYHCDMCSNWLDEDDIWTYGNYTMCESCYHEHVVQCRICTDSIWEENGHYHTVNDETYCNDCYDARFGECHECGEEIRFSHAVQIHGKYYCMECGKKVTCDICGEDLYNVDAYELDSAMVCETYYEEEQKNEVD